MKKIISFLVCVVMITSTGLAAFAYTEGDAMKILQAMDVISGDPDGNLRSDDMVKRSEFAKMAVILSEYKNLVSLNSKISVFIDCTSSHWAAPYVKVAAENGIIEGYSNGRFGPDDNITYAQAVTIALRLLGYTDEDFGYSYPEGQLGMALSLKLNSSLEAYAEKPLTRGEVCVIFANMLSTNKKDSNMSYIDYIGYSIKEDTIIIASNDESASVAPGKIYTSNGEFTISENFDKSLIGKKGSAVINSDGKLITLLENGSKAQKYAVYTAGSELVSVSGSEGVISLDCDDNTLSYDDIQKTTFSAIRSKLSIGDLIIIGKDRYGNTDYIISGVSDFDGPYTVRTDISSLTGRDYSQYTVVKNGKSAQYSDIKKYDILYISSSLSTLFVYSKKVSGIYSAAVPNIDSPKSIVLGGKEYEIESSVAFSKLSSGGSYKTGDSIVALIGRNGGIADIMDDAHYGLGSTNPIMKTESNVTDATYALLSQLGAISSTSLENDNTDVTRGEFAKMAVMISGYRNKVSLGSKVSVFPDCPSSYWATPYIRIAAENKLMSAYSNSLFYPQNSVTYAEAVDTALKILGYTDSDFSDWPSAQISMAKSKGITKDVQKDAFSYVTKSEAIKILYNTLLCANKNGTSNQIESIGYQYYEDALIIATNNENTSVPSGKVLTSEGTYSIDSLNFDYSNVGKSGELLVYSGKLQMFNKKASPYTESVVYSAIPGGLAVMGENGVSTISVPDSVSVYIGASKTTFLNAKNTIAVGDTAFMYYDDLKRLKYVYIDTSSLKGPYTVKSASGWFNAISGASNDTAIMKNGEKITSSQLLINDILYYSASLDTAFVYNDKVIGIFESASPAKDSPDTIKVSGTNYALEVADAFKVDADYGDTVVLCLGRNGKVAHSYSASSVSLAGYLTSTGVKEFTNSNGEKYTSMYAHVVLADGTEIDCATDYDYKNWINKVMSLTFNGGKARLVEVSTPGKIYGSVDADNLKIGTSNVSSNVKILDVGYNQTHEPTIYKNIYLQRINGVSLSASDVIYSKSENGYITELILKNASGDAFSYGVVTSANTTINDNTASGSYTCDIGGSSYSYSGGAYINIKKGNIVQASLSGGRIKSLTKLNPQVVSVKELGYNVVTLTNGKSYILSDDVVVYKISGNTTYTYLPLSEVVENKSSYSNFCIYTDKAESSGGRVRIITVK